MSKILFNGKIQHGKLTHFKVSKSFKKKSKEANIIAVPTILEARMVINLTQHSVRTEKMIAPPIIATYISLDYKANKLITVSENFKCKITHPECMIGHCCDANNHSAGG